MPPSSPAALSTPAEAVTLSGSIDPTRLSMAYRAGLVVVALAMVLLPFIYMGLVAAAGAAVWWHATTNTWLLAGRSFQWRLLAYLTPVIIGSILVFFMIKPILARPSKREEPVPIDPGAEPSLFAFIHQICHQVRAPRPRLVQVDCQVNASASFTGGLPGLFRRDLVLTIGLPLAAGLTVRELGGVLAHEFGHFAQGGGMRLTTIVRGINGWFARVAYQRDKWDDQLDEWSQKSDWRVSIVLSLAQVAIWLSRRILVGLMMVGHAISCFMMRQMEYDADSYEVKFAGSAAFEHTSARLRELGLAAHVSYNELGATIATRQLPANLPRFVMDRLSRFPGAMMKQLRGSSTRRTGVFDTHPSDADRLHAATAVERDGVLVGGDGPATALFRDFDGLSAAATRHHYEHDLGLATDTLTLVDTERAIRDSRSRDSHRQALGRFFGEGFSPTRPVRAALGEVDALDRDAVPAMLRQARGAMEADAGHIASRHRQAEALEARRDKAFAAHELLLAGFTLQSATDFDLAEATAHCADSTQTWALEQLRVLAPALDASDNAAARRLACGVRLAADASGSNEPRELARTLEAVATAVPEVHELRRLAIPHDMLDRIVSAKLHPAATSRQMALSKQITACRARMRERLHGVPCPQWLSPGPADLATWCGLSADRNAPPNEVIDRVQALYFDVLGRLTIIALEAEDALVAL